MKKDKMKMVLYAGICTMALAGTSLTSYADTETTPPGITSQMERPEDDGSVIARILTVDDDSITVYLSSQPERNGERRDQSGEWTDEIGNTAPAGLPADAGNIPAKPDNSDGTMPERPVGENGEGGRGMMNFSEEETTLTITDDTVITTGLEQESADLSDLDTNSIVRIVLDDDNTVVSISIMDMAAPQVDAE